MLNAKISDVAGAPLVDVVDGYVRLKAEGMEIETRPGRVRILVSLNSTLIPQWVRDKLTAKDVLVGIGGMCLLDIEVVSAGVVAALLRPGRAGANDADDHITLLHRALSGLPEEYQTGHFTDDDPALVTHPILVRADAAGATHGFVEATVAANCDFSIGFPIDQGVRDAMLLVQEEDWIQATETDGSVRDGAWVAELTDLIPLFAWPQDTRLLMRRERPHPGAQLTLFDTSEGFRHTCFITNTKGADVCALELRHRGHARVEDRIRNWKDCGLANLPFDPFVRNEAWVTISLIAGALLAWSQMVCFEGALAKAEPKTMRYRVLHVAALLVHRSRGLVLRLDKTWPWANDLSNAFVKLRAAIP